MSDAVLSALITGSLSMLGVYLANRRSRVLMEYRLDELTKQVAKHNSVVERTYELERRASVAEAQLRTAERRIDDLEHTK